MKSRRWREAGVLLACLLAVCALVGLTWWLLGRHSRGAEIANDVGLPLAAISAAATVWTVCRPDLRSRLEKGTASTGQSQAETDAVGTAADADAHALGVHPAFLAGWLPDSQPLTPYLLRQHDVEFRAAISRAAQGRTSVFALLTGDSATGKTRALVEALRAVIPDRTIRRPRDAGDLSRMIHDGEVNSRTVLWLNETQKFLYGELGARAASELDRLLSANNGIIAVGAIWTKPYLRELTALGRSPDIYADARELLSGLFTTRITVPAFLDHGERELMMNLAPDDKRLSIAVTAAAKDGRVIQHLAGGPELLEEYLNGSLFDPVEHALISAALDMRRLGYEAPIPGPMLSVAADGYLSPSDRPSGGDYWAHGLAAITRGARPDDSRSDVRNILTALSTYRLAKAPGTYYEVDGYLDQQMRKLRDGMDGPPELWEAFVAHISDADELYRLGSAARRKNLGDSACSLLRKAVTMNHPYAAAGYVAAAKTANDQAAEVAGFWAANHTRLDNPYGLALLLEELQAVRANEAIATLMTRDPAGHVSLANPYGVALLLEHLQLTDNDDVSAALLARNPAAHVTLQGSYGIAVLLRQLRSLGRQQDIFDLLGRQPGARVSLLDPGGVAFLIKQLQEAGAGDQVWVLARRASTQMSLVNPANVASLLRILAELKAASQIDLLLAREPAAHVSLDDPGAVAFLLRQLRDAGAREQVAVLAFRATAEVSLDDPYSVAFLLRELRGVEAAEATAAVLARDPASHLSLANSQGVALALKQLKESGAPEAAARLARRAAAGISLDNPQDVATLIRQLLESGCQEAISTLLDRDLAAQVRLDKPGGVAFLLNQLREAGAGATLRPLARRAARQMELDDPQGVALVLQQLREAELAGTTRALLARNPAASVRLEDPGSIGFLLSQLRETSATAPAVLLARNPAEHVAVDDPRGVASLLKQFREMRASESIAALLAREPAATVRLSDARGVGLLSAELRHIGAVRSSAILTRRARQFRSQ